jgi:diaminohydroxyphosphoribosylaminopyrimidine deaminase / 5-amino-6-(5-phosphoribosylamino)uracil reductase
MNEFTKYMQCVLQLAEKGIGNVAPNPMVGCVIVHPEHGVIGVGYHQICGQAHAEVNAINSVSNKSLLPESTLYVNLEPCSHFGKTPPCSDLIIEHKIKRVVIGCLDTNPLVAGKGIEKLRHAGIEVVTDVLKEECRNLNKRFFTFHEKKRPYIILKWAQTKDGFIVKLPPFTREQNWITNNESNKISHTWRAQEEAILVGTNTAIIDNPKLTARLSEGKNPIRILIDKDLKVPLTNSIFSDEAETIVFTNKSQTDKKNISYHQIDFTKDIIPQILNVLYDKKITSLIVEGGTHTLQSFISKQLWDEARVFTGNKYFKEGMKAPEISKKEASIKMIGEDELRVFIR